jgi:class 3 adenylate cyclase/tetratricopeptide (TPR) repeat protein
VTVCPRCDQENPERAKFCLQCAAPLGGAPARSEEARKVVTILFSDLVRSSYLVERLDPESLGEVMGRYFSDVRAVLVRHGGTVEKIIGDAVMAVFGIPSVHEDDALRAVRAALDIRQSVTSLNEQLANRWNVTLEFRMGISTGEVFAGDPASRESFAFGRTVNVAARLEQAADPGEILLGADTYRLVREAVRAEMLPPLELKDHPDPISAYRLREPIREHKGVGRQLHAPLIGRHGELHLLVRSYEQAVESRCCQLIIVLGEAGVGKSRLADELMPTVAQEPLLVSGRCLPYGDGITFWPMIEVIRRVAGITDEDLPEEAHSKVLAPLTEERDAALIAERVTAAMGTSPSPTVTEQIFWGIRRFLECLSRRQPLIAVFDDMQWAEETFLDLVEYLVARSKNAPILVVCLARPTLLDARPQWVVDKDNNVIVLKPLSAEDSERLVGSLLGIEAALPDEARRWIVRTGAGNPLFMEEILRMMIDEGYLQRSHDGWALLRDVSSLSPPPTIQALLAARIDALSREEKAVLQRASVVGQVFWWGAVRDLVPKEDKSTFGNSLQGLVRRELIRPSESSFVGEDAFRFGHILIHDATYAAISKSLRAELHERFASWLEHKAEARIREYQEILGYHLEQAYIYRRQLARADQSSIELAHRAASALVPAARRASDRGDMPSALNLFERAEAVLADDERARVSIQPELAAVLMDTGELVRAETLLSRTISAATTLGDASIEAYARLERLRLHIFGDRGGALDETRREVERVISDFEDLSDNRGLAKAWKLLGSIHSYCGQLADAEEAWERALTFSLAADSEQQASEALALLADILDFGPTPVGEGIERCNQILNGAGGDQKVTASALISRSALRAMRGEFEEARHDVFVGRGVYEELGLSLLAANCSQNSGLIEMLAGDARAAEKQLRSGYAALEAMNEAGYLATIGAQLAHALIAQGRDDDAREFVSVSRRAAAEDDASAQALWRTAQAKILMLGNDFGEGERLAREAVAITEQTDFLNYRADAAMDLAIVLSSAGKTTEAIEAAKVGLELYRRKGNTVAEERARGELFRLSGTGASPVSG